MATLEDLNKALLEGEVIFSFEKKDGSERIARGTKKREMVPDSSVPIGKEYHKSDEVIRYYDLDKQDWRSFRKDKFIDIKDGK